MIVWINPNGAECKVQSAGIFTTRWCRKGMVFKMENTIKIPDLKIIQDMIDTANVKILPTVLLVSDDSPGNFSAVSQAVHSLPDSGGTILLKGIFRTDSLAQPWLPNLHISKPNVTIAGFDDNSGFSNHTVAAQIAINNAGCKNLTLKNLKIFGNIRRLILHNAENVIFDNVRGNADIEFYQISQFVVKHCTFNSFEMTDCSHGTVISNIVLHSGSHSSVGIRFVDSGFNIASLNMGAVNDGGFNNYIVQNRGW